MFLASEMRASKERRVFMTNLSGGNVISYQREAQWAKAKCVCPAVAVIVILAGLLVVVVACSQRAERSPAQQSGAGNSQTDIRDDHAKAIASPAGPTGSLPLRTLTDIPLTGGATRLDYRSLHSPNSTPHIAHFSSD